MIKPARDALIERHRRARAAYNRAMDAHAAALDEPAEIGIDETSDAFVDSPAYREARARHAEMATIEEEYFRRLPRLAIAACPHCDKSLFRAFDPFGLDGFWWRSDAQPDEPPACHHFCLLQGAVKLAAETPGPDFEVHPGPAAPFVIPRVLEQPDMVAVLSELSLVDGSSAYAVAYFAARRPPVQTLAASWARTNFVYTTQLGAHAWRAADDPCGPAGAEQWDFDLRPWVTARKVLWCDPGTDRTRLSTTSPEACPFLDLPGVRSAQVIRAKPTSESAG